MIKEKIEKYFSTQPHLRVLFFFDKEQEFKEEVETLELNDVRIVNFEQNYFYLKTMLHGEWKQEKVLLYLPLQSPNQQEEYLKFPLLDLLLANKELLLNDVAAFMEEHHLQRHHQPLIQRYIRELKYSTVQEVCAPVLKSDTLDEQTLVQALFSAFLKFKSLEGWPVLLAKLLSLVRPGQEEELKRVVRKVRDNDLLDWLNKQIKRFFDQELSSLEPESLAYLLKVLKYNTLMQYVPELANEDPYKHLRIKQQHVLSRINQLLEEARRNDGLAAQLQQALEATAEAIQELKLMQVYGPQANYGYYSLSMKWELIAGQVKSLDTNPQDILLGLENIRTTEPSSPALNSCLTFIMYAAAMIKRLNLIPDYILKQPDDYIRTYATDWFKVDQAYRRAFCAFHMLDDTEVPKQINLHDLVQLVNKRYEEFLERSNREWLKCLRTVQFDYKQLKVHKQYDFFKNELAQLEQKTAVIISDALRFEAAEELLSELHGDAKNSADIRYQLASIPSKTSVGMSQLLPGKKFAFNEGSITIDGIPTTGLENRGKLLAAADPEARVVQFAELKKNNQEQNREIFKSKLVYIYHDAIDSIGDKKSSERMVLGAVKDAIEELKLMVKKLHGSFNVTRVIITADHGFLYNDRDIDETAKENPTGLTAITTHNRYEIVDDAGKPPLGYKIPLSATSLFPDDLSVIIPASVNRYKKAGAGHQFVHGGGSLQELVVPIIESSRKRHEIAQKVMPVLARHGSLKIVSNVLRLNIMQENKVSRTEKERELILGIYKNTELVSNPVTLLLNSTSELPSGRMFNAELTLYRTAANESYLKLKVFDKEDDLNPLIEESVENNTLIGQDF